ncbi:uncharacterized protein LOC121640032 [Melanotaenia boesemani]|uniref:uncharacterized protein LOC121640032 n=1 Tax=Melanotaenia boesemani TaxID=1250792 RepID=UPI001C041BD0|nr:uncharacterized protein LOC121640032 [Melanotaenia boesemani]
MRSYSTLVKIIMMSVLKLFLLLSCWTFTGTMAEPLKATYYVLRNNFVCLNVSKSPPYSHGKWEFSGEVIYHEEGINPSYKEKAWPGPKYFSLCIKMLTDNDTGIYKFSFTHNFIIVYEPYQVIIQDMVPRPVMMMTSEHHSNLTEGSCSVTVNCSIQDNLLWSVCDEDGCRPPQKSFHNFNITVFTENRTVVCSGNNHVSTNNITERMETACFSKSNPDPKEEPQQHHGTVIYILSGLGCMLVCSFLAIKLFSALRKHQATTRAALLIPSGPLEMGTQSNPRVSTSSSSEAEPSYENVEMPQPREISIPIEQQFSWESKGANTVYSVPRRKDSRFKTDSGEESARHRNTQESVTLDATRHPTQTETVYCLLEKPKDVRSQHLQES